MFRRYFDPVVLGLVVAAFGAGSAVHPLQVAAQTRTLPTLTQVYDLLREEFIDRKVDDSKLEYAAIRGMLESLDDPYTRFMEPKAFQSMQDERSGAFFGIGIQIGMNKDKHLSVIAPLEDTPAAKAGLKSGDLIVEIDGKPTKTMAIEEAVTLIRGNKGTKVTLTIQRGPEKPFPVAIVRDSIATKAVKVRELAGGVGYIRLSTFMAENADSEMRDALKKFKSAPGIVLDLRGNPGGLLPNAVSIGSMFIGKETVVQIVDREGFSEKLRGPGAPVVPARQPVVVLVDGGSASASEILSGALQDTHRATLVGTKTFGKGLVQTVHSLENGGGIAITTNKYLTAAGHDINKKGIVPDVVVEFPPVATGSVDAESLPTLDELISAGKDVQLNKALDLIDKASAS
ncbi:MAG: S41 family peptidase [bacterium]|nr:S41 family peptidase [bacterium]